MSQNWWTSDIFSTDNFGPINNADPTTAPCVVEGAFAWHTVADDPDKHRVITSGNLTCLRRNAIQTAMTDATTISESLSATSFVQLTRSAPSDYYDVLHHGFVDKYWWRWQQLCPSFVTDYEGNLERADDPISGGSTVADFNQTFDSWSNFIVWDMLNTEGDTLCYTYSASAGDLAIPAVTCPAVAAVNVPATTTSSVSATSAAAAAESAVDNSWVDAIFITLIASTTFSENNTSTVIFGRRDIRADASTVNRNITTSDAAIIEIKTAEAKSDFENSQASNTVDSINTISTSTATKLTWTFTLNPDNSSTVFYIGADHNITVPAGYSISEVFRGSVTGINKSTRKPKRFFPEVGSIVYVRHPDTPVVVVPGEHPCHLAAPILLKSSYIEAMGMSWAVYLNAHNVEKMKIDAFNINNCTTLSSPSSMMNQ
ncbi:hypothetical protein HK100_003291 [Physocladia obscura]|uniref:Uncharacterized protein n=1 Tax=Physocladia obscura TaxID=109957 RepID=A0AAD5T9B5_9FUNG|nr:hypothetical protein HK100_003291 [Physocladia obscura]